MTTTTTTPPLLLRLLLLLITSSSPFPSQSKKPPALIYVSTPANNAEIMRKFIEIRIDLTSHGAQKSSWEWVRSRPLSEAGSSEGKAHHAWVCLELVREAFNFTREIPEERVSTCWDLNKDDVGEFIESFVLTTMKYFYSQSHCSILHTLYITFFMNSFFFLFSIFSYKQIPGSSKQHVSNYCPTHRDDNSSKLHRNFNFKTGFPH